MDGDGAAVGSISTSARVTPTMATATSIRLTATDTPIRIMDTHIRVTVMADTTHTGVVTRGVTGGGGISRAVAILKEGGEQTARRPQARATDKTRASSVRRRW